MMMTELQRTLLIQTALDARANAYAPYSHFTVGAALLTADGTAYRGCNIENATYGATNCAERTAVYNAVSSGARDFFAIAIAGGAENQPPQTYAYPCGICRQVLAEFCAPDLTVYVARSVSDYKEYTLGELLPEAFSL